MAIAGATKRAGGDGDDFVWMKNADFALETGEKTKSTKAGGGPDFTSEGDTFSEADGIGFFVMKTEGGAYLFGKEEFEGIRTEVEYGGAKRRGGHREVKADG